MGAVLAAERALLAGLSAAAAHGFWGYPSPEAIELLTDSLSRPRLPGVRSRRTLSLPSTDRTRLRFIPMTTAERTFVDTCGAVPLDRLGELGDDLLRRRVLVMPKLVRCFEAIPVSGRRKSRPMRLFFAERVDGWQPGGSKHELDVRLVIVRAGYPPPVQQYKVIAEGHTHFLDHAWPDTMHAIEFEGFDCHGELYTPFHRDRERVRRLQRAGRIWPVTSQTTVNEILAIAALATGHQPGP
jgi:hypothetical protein